MYDCCYEDEKKIPGSSLTDFSHSCDEMALITKSAN